MFLSEDRIPRALIVLLAASCSVLPGFGQYARNRYALILQDEPVASRFVTREQMRTAGADGYRRQLSQRQSSVHQELARRGVPVISSVSEVLNAVFVSATPDRLAELAAIPGVIGVRPMRQMHLTLNKATQLMNAPAAWSLVGGQSKAGAGIKIGILDTGIDQNHPAFQDSSLSAPAGFPKCSGSADACSYTNSKVIVARSYVSQIVIGNEADPKNPAADSIPDDYSPRDHVGHGTAVASAAAGNTNTGSVTFTGMAPKAWIGNYKIWGSPSVNDAPPEDVWITALNDAVTDGMDVINMSSGGVALTGPLDTGAACGIAANVPCDALATAFENAAKTAVVVVAAGNGGSDGYNYPSFNTISSPATAPSVIAVGATTNSHAHGSEREGAGYRRALQPDEHRRPAERFLLLSVGLRRQYGDPGGRGHRGRRLRLQCAGSRLAQRRVRAGAARAHRFRRLQLRREGRQRTGCGRRGHDPVHVRRFARAHSALRHRERRSVYRTGRRPLQFRWSRSSRTIWRRTRD